MYETLSSFFSCSSCSVSSVVSSPRFTPTVGGIELAHIFVKTEVVNWVLWMEDAGQAFPAAIQWRAVRRRAATRRGYRVSRQAVVACLWPQRPCEVNGSCTKLCAFSKHGQSLARAARRGCHGQRPEARNPVARASCSSAELAERPQRPCEVNAACARPGSFALHGPPGRMPGPPWHAPRDAVATACGRRRATPWRGHPARSAHGGGQGGGCHHRPPCPVQGASIYESTKKPIFLCVFAHFARGNLHSQAL